MYKQGQAVAVSFQPRKKFRLLTRGRRFYMALAGVVRLTCCGPRSVQQLYNTGAVQRPNVVTDMATYQRLAAEVRAGKWPEVFDYQLTQYSCPWWHVAVAGWAPLAGAAGAGYPGLGGSLADRTGGGPVFGRRAGDYGSLLLALSRFHIFYTPYLLLEVLQISGWP